MKYEPLPGRARLVPFFQSLMSQPSSWFLLGPRKKGLGPLGSGQLVYSSLVATVE